MLHSGCYCKCCLQVHGCLLQAKQLLEINAQSVGTSDLLQAVLPPLQLLIRLMHPDDPCAPVCNEAILVLTAVMALPTLPRTAEMAALLHQVHHMCHMCISQSSNRTAELSSEHSNVASGDSNREHMESGGNNRKFISAEAVPQCDAEDPMTCLRLKHATLLFFGSGLQQALKRAAPIGTAQPLHVLKEEEVQVALECRNYDVRAACLKAFIQRTSSGMSAVAVSTMILCDHTCQHASARVSAWSTYAISCPTTADAPLQA